MVQLQDGHEERVCPSGLAMSSRSLSDTRVLPAAAPTSNV
ncbi:hypothetical protein PC116_g19999 [Phytophthora cactorum]|nr:hypothetical protein PC114_g17461 [Phytophthora cactorum]KAG3000989.1 hypothetical protein PC119_g16887 [Phytophthora cactorum]KAG3172222.1 hypothetical protein PC128_g18572 [Phytophthora cactorum]KAG4231736.1 hypothetical protein PC116_g19999 [Phytophthora cactorum]